MLHGQASQSKKGEDFTLIETALQRDPGDSDATFSVFAVRDRVYLLMFRVLNYSIGGCCEFVGSLKLFFAFIKNWYFAIYMSDKIISFRKIFFIFCSYLK